MYVSMGATPMEIGTSACDTGVSRQMSARDSFRRHAPRQVRRELLFITAFGRTTEHHGDICLMWCLSYYYHC